MKKILNILLCGIIIIGITGCGKKISKEEMINQAKDLEANDLFYDLIKNFKNAKEKYIGNIYSINGGVLSVEDNYVKIALSENYDYDYIKVFLSSDELSQINSDTKINFVGKISRIEKNKDDVIVVYIKNAYYISDYVKITGSIKCLNRSKKCQLSVPKQKVDEDDDTVYELRGNILSITAFGATINGVQVNNNDNITISAKVEYDSTNFWNVIDIQNVEVN